MDDMQARKEVRAAIKQGDVQKVRELLGADRQLLEAMTPFGTWLHVAASFGNLDIVQFLVSLGADVNRKGGTFSGGAVNEAASSGHLNVVQYLLSCGAEMDVSEPQYNPLFSAIYRGHLAVAQVLIEEGIDIHVTYNGENMKNMDALAFAREWGRTDIAKLLVSRGVR